MENWMTRIVGLFCALGSLGLFWTLGVFVVVPLRDGRMLSLNLLELQVIGVALVLGVATQWGAFPDLRGRRSERKSTDPTSPLA